MFLPMTKQEMVVYGWQEPDIILVSGDAYVDHPSFGAAIISRVLENAGFRVCMLPQPQTDADYMRFGTPRLGFFVTSGNIDSMVAHYTAAKRKRSSDAYSAGGRAGMRPDRAVIVYSKAIRRLFGEKMPIVIGGLEASLRRFAHYDYWDDAVRPSILLDAQADVLVFGMGERATVEVAKRLADGANVHDVRGICYAVAAKAYEPRPCAECPAYALVKEPTDSGKKQYAKACRMQHEEHDAYRGKTVIQRHDDYIVVQNPPALPLDQNELDAAAELPYMRNYHPSYEQAGGVPAIEEVQFSIIHNRGCYGACAFCSLAYHQGRVVTARSKESVVNEAKQLTMMPDFKGYIHDVGGPTANFRAPACDTQQTNGACKSKRCLAPGMCSAIKPGHTEYLDILRTLRQLPGVKKVFVRSGIRYDYLIADGNEAFFKELVQHHISGQLKVAPEHCSDKVLDIMGKPHFDVYLKFQKRFYELTKAAGKKQFLVPYMISSHPGSTIDDAIALALYLKKEKLHPEQVQDFYPTPGTIATCMYYTGLDPHTMQPVYVPRSAEEKAQQRALLQYYRKENADIVRAALRKAGRIDLIGQGSACLVSSKPALHKEKSKRIGKKTRANRRTR